MWKWQYLQKTVMNCNYGSGLPKPLCRWSSGGVFQNTVLIIKKIYQIGIINFQRLWCCFLWYLFLIIKQILLKFDMEFTIMDRRWFMTSDLLTSIVGISVLKRQGFHVELTLTFLQVVVELLNNDKKKVSIALQCSFNSSISYYLMIHSNTCSDCSQLEVNSLTPGRCDNDFILVILSPIKDILSISCETSLWWMPKDPTDD